MMGNFPRALGYQQIVGAVASTALTVPAGAGMALISCAGAAVRWRDDGTAPTASVGYPLPVGGELVYTASNLAQLRFIETAPTATLDICYYGV